MGMFAKARPEDAARVLPNHIGVIMDGNGRWAKKRGLPRRMGHSKGAKTFKEICRYCNKIGIKYLTAYAFSTENWKRPQEEVDAIMELLKEYLQDAHNYKDENIKTRFIGDRSALSDELVRLMEDAERESAGATGMTLNIAINYGGRDEIVRAARSLAEQVKNGRLQPGDIDEAMLSSQMYTGFYTPATGARAGGICGQKPEIWRGLDENTHHIRGRGDCLDGCDPAVYRHAGHQLCNRHIGASRHV